MVLVHVLLELRKHRVRAQFVYAAFDRPYDVDQIECVQPLVGQLAERHVGHAEHLARPFGALALAAGLRVPGRDAVADDAYPHLVSGRREPRDRAAGAQGLVIRMRDDDEDRARSVSVAQARDHRASASESGPALQAARASERPLVQKNHISVRLLVR